MPHDRYEYNRKWRDDNPNKQREYNLRHRHDMSVADYDAFVERHGGVCNICASDTPKRGASWAIDHDWSCENHENTYQTCEQCRRGILCHSCNQKLGWYERNREAIDRYIVERAYA